MADFGAKIVTERTPTEAELRAMLFGWRVVKHVKSNAIVYATPIARLGLRRSDVADRCIAHRGSGKRMKLAFRLREAQSRVMPSFRSRMDSSRPQMQA